MKVLVLGGTRFFGKRLVDLLVRRGHEVTVATRGRTGTESLIGGVLRITVDRTDRAAMIAAFADRRYDLVYDQIGYTPSGAAIAVEAFGERIGRYVFTSSMAVYDDTDKELGEEAFDPYRYPIEADRESFDYNEGKRQAEAYLFRHAPFPVASIRVSLVISGEDDYTGRFAYHMEKVINGEPIRIIKPFALSYIAADDLADFLYFIGIETKFIGPVNANNTGWLSMEDFVAEIGRAAGRTPLIECVGEQEERSPYSVGVTLKLSNRAAASLGYRFRPVRNAVAEEASRYIRFQS